MAKQFCRWCNATIRDGEARLCPACGREAPPEGWPQDSLVGQTIVAGQYRVVRRIGSGGFGIVYEVETLVGGLRRALKVLHSQWASDERARQEFVQEALTLEQVNHPNVGRCYAAGTLGESGDLYLLLELIDGRDLDALCAASGPGLAIEPLRAVNLARQIGSGLVAAHARGVLHRDLKPANVLIVRPGQPDEQVKLVDFGLAKLVAEPSSTARVAGTPEFMAPEQFTPGVKLGPAVDLWQLGALLYFMLTGQPPYRMEPGDSPFAILRQQEQHAAAGPRPGEVVPALAALTALDAYVSRLLAGDPARRPRSAADVCTDLARIEQVLGGGAEADSAAAILEALCAHADHASWLTLCRYLQASGNTTHALQLAEDYLARWPDEYRCAPCSWWEAVRDGGSHPLWRLVRALDLSHRGLTDEDAARLAASPACARLRWLNLAGNQLGREALAALAASPHLQGLECLDLSSNRITSGAVEALLRETKLGKLRVLKLAENGVGARGAQALAASGLGLRHLDLSYNDIRAAGAAALAESTAMRSLEVLCLAGNRIGADGVAALAVSQHLNLVELDLSRNELGPGGAASLALSSSMTRLRILRLANNGLSRRGLQLLLASAGFESLQELDLAGNEIDAAAALVLTSSPITRRLNRLQLGDNLLGDAGLATLLGAPNLAGLRALDVSQNRLTEAGARLLTGGHPQLVELGLSANPLGHAGAAALGESLTRMRVHVLYIVHCGFEGEDVALIVDGAGGRLRDLHAAENVSGPAGAAALAALPAAAGLRRLDLSGNNLGAKGVQALASSPHLAGLRSLSLNSNHLETAGAAALARASGGLLVLGSLALADNQIGPEGAAALATAALAARLHTLDLGHNALGDRGAEVLARGAGWLALRDLRLPNNDIGFSGLASVLASSGLGALQRLDVSHNALLGVTDLHSLSAGKVAVLEASFARIAAHGADFAERFYANMFARHPQVKALFASTDMRRQQEHLLSALVMVIDHLRHPDALQERLAGLGDRHLGYGVVPSHYYAMAGSLLETIREALADEWTQEIHDAWQEGLEAISRVMMGSSLKKLSERPTAVHARRHAGPD